MKELQRISESRAVAGGRLSVVRKTSPSPAARPRDDKSTRERDYQDELRPYLPAITFFCCSGERAWYSARKVPLAHPKPIGFSLYPASTGASSLPVTTLYFSRMVPVRW